MALEDLTGSNKFISNLVPVNPADGDDIREGAAHLRGTKNVLINTFPNVNGAVTATDEQLNRAGAADPALKVNKAGDAMSGNLAMLYPAAFQLQKVDGLAPAWFLSVGADDGLVLFCPMTGDAPMLVNPTTGAMQVKAFSAESVASTGGISAGGFSTTGAVDAGTVEASTSVLSREVTAGDVVDGGGFTVYSSLSTPGGFPTLRMLLGGIALWSQAVDGDGSMVWSTGAPTPPMAVSLGGAVRFADRIRSLSAGGGGRLDTGFIHTQTGYDVGKAPGIVRGRATTVAGGTVSVTFDGLTFPEYACVAVAESASPVVVTVTNRTTTGCTLIATDLYIQPVVGVVLSYVVVPAALAPG